MIMYCCEFENTKDGSLNFSPENILNRQLVFTTHLSPYQKKNYRWIKYDVGHEAEEILVDRFEKKFKVKVIWQTITDSHGNPWNGWVIQE